MPMTTSEQIAKIIVIVPRRSRANLERIACIAARARGVRPARQDGSSCTSGSTERVTEPEGIAFCESLWLVIEHHAC